MANWRNLQHKSNLTNNELRQIPGASCENYITALDYFVTDKGYSEKEILNGLEASPEFLKNPRNWLNALDEQTFNINIFKNSKSLFTHYDYYSAGLNATFSDNSLFVIMVKLLSAGRIFKEISKTVKKFNNDNNIVPVNFTNGHSLFLIDDYPFYRDISVGHECHFTAGVFAVNLIIHNISDYSIKHVICCKRIKNIINYAYGHYNLKYQESDGEIFISDKKIGKFVTLKYKIINKQKVYSNEIDHNNEIPNAILITNEYVLQDRIIFKKGEIYNAPHCLLDVHWKEPNFFNRLKNIGLNRELKSLSVQEMEKQIEYTNDKLFELKETLNESERKSNIFKIYTRNSLVEEVDKGKNPIDYAPTEMNKAVLFNDIRDFTSLSEKMSALDVVKFLNSYFDRVNDVIMHNNGEIDKLIGDCIMAGFDNPDDGLKAAISGRKKLYEYNNERVSNKLPKISTGTGLTYGEVIVGNIGSKSKMDFTLIGDTVNAASRLESLTKYYGVGIIISEDVKKELKNDYKMRFLDLVLVKGKKEPMKIYEVYEQKPEHIKEKRERIQPKLDEAFHLYSKGIFKDAHQIYSELIEEVGNHTYNKTICADPIIPFYKNRCEIISKQIKSGIMNKSAWKGIYEFTDK